MKYAVLDWDNTIRSGYTMFSLIDYLCKSSVLPLSIKISIDKLTAQYQSKEITHDQYAEFACIEFAQSLCGYAADQIIDCIQQYLNQDKECLFPFATTIFEFLYQNNIDPIIVSGAPICVLHNYADIFHIKKIYGFDIEQKNGIYTGKVKSNYGFNKGLILSKLIASYESPPYMGFGDSPSDYPLLQLSKHSFFIRKSQVDSPPKNIISLSPDMPTETVKSILSKIDIV